ncbi:unnamed protein product [Miscanthus lutarioriparius]|uniref:Uncharacterized protein n=1 Tax=Miscanthus lutarioriparius TaxID=422564 RepID=A0A811M8T7_9POAL|nr:unnamed protein product [Miscanthus lutarioriparius]
MELTFTFVELKTATKNFPPDSVLGEGGFGRVYKGWVDEKTMAPTRNNTGMTVVVKKLNSKSMQGYEQWQGLKRSQQHNQSVFSCQDVDHFARKLSSNSNCRFKAGVISDEMLASSYHCYYYKLARPQCNTVYREV